MAQARFTAGLFSRFAAWRRRWRHPEQLTSAELGLFGERLAERHLRRHGYRVLRRNFRAPHGGEVDLVCRDRRARTLVFVEVKTRRSVAYGQPAEAVDAAKQELITRGGMAWLRLLEFPEINYRFDVVEVVFEGPTPRVHVIQDAFSSADPGVY